MPLLDSLPTVDEIEKQYGNDVFQEPRNEFAMLPAEYEKTYGPQFRYELKLISRAISYNVSDCHFSATLGLGVHNKIWLAVVLHRDPRKNYIIPLLLFERCAQGILFKMLSFLEAMELLAVKEEQLRRNLLPHCEIGEQELEN